MSFYDLLPESARDELEKAIRKEKTRQQAMASMTPESLVVTTRFFMANCQSPDRFPKGEPVYDSTVWHIIIPELLNRVRQTQQPEIRMEINYQTQNQIIQMIGAHIGAWKDEAAQDVLEIYVYIDDDGWAAWTRDIGEARGMETSAKVYVTQSSTSGEVLSQVLNTFKWV